MIVRLIVQTLVSYGVMGLLLFWAAGTLDWPDAWIYLTLMIVVSLVGGLWLVRRDPGLVRERLEPPIQKDQPLADKVVLSVFLVLFLGWQALMGLDAVRYRWSFVPPWAQAIGALVLLVSLWIGFRTLRANSFAAPVVKIQSDRGQAVISTGPYAYVRHPLYAGALGFMVGTSLLLGSLWGLGAVLVLALLLAVRILIEERTLRAGLAGYNDYARRVRYRLIPGLW